MKKVFFVTITAVLLLSAAYGVGMESPQSPMEKIDKGDEVDASSGPTKREWYVQKLSETCDFYISKLQVLENDVRKVFKVQQELEKIDDRLHKLSVIKPFPAKKFAALDEQKNVLYAKNEPYLDAFEALMLIDTNWSWQVTKTLKEYQERIHIAISTLTAYKTCYLSGTTPSPFCGTIKEDCGLYGYDENGLFQLNTADLKTIDRENVYLKFDTLSMMSRFEAMLCGIKGADKGHYKQVSLFPRFNLRPKRVTQIELLLEEEKFKKYCLDTDWQDEHNLNLDKLKAEYPDFVESLYNIDMPSLRNICMKVVEAKCQNTYVIKNEVILAYETVGCEIFEVTKKDVEAQIQGMYSQVDKLKQSTLIDEIDICKAAMNKGYAWGYKKPELSAKCVVQKKKEKEIEQAKKKAKNKKGKIKKNKSS